MRPHDPRHLFPAALALLLLAAPARAAYQALEEIPVESPVYRLVEELATSHGSRSAFLHTRPWDRADLGRFLDELALREPAVAGDPAYVRLRREVEPADVPGGWRPAMRGKDENGSLEISPYARMNYAEDRSRRGLVRDFRVGGQGSYALGDNVLFAADAFAGTYSPGPHGNPVTSRHFGLIEGVEFNSWFDRGTATLRGRLGRLVIGHTWLRWGPGAWGSMALSDGAPAFDVIEARVPVLGRAQLEWFLASLDPTTQSYLAGHRLEWRPSAAWDIAFGELARFDGAATAPMYLVPVISYSHLERRVQQSSRLSGDSLVILGKNNVMWTADASWRARRDLRLYGELTVDDISFSSELKPREIGWQLGFDARRLAGGRAWTLRGEYARVYQYTYSTYHHHNFEFEGMPTGFPLGPDVERANARLECRATPALAVGVEGALTRKGAGRLGEFYVPGSGHVYNNLALTGIVDADARGAVTADWSPAGGLAAGVTAGWSRVTALDHVAGNDRSGGWLETRCTLRW
jgi:hypothetical protein